MTVPSTVVQWQVDDASRHGGRCTRTIEPGATPPRQDAIQGVAPGSSVHTRSRTTARKALECSTFCAFGCCTPGAEGLLKVTSGSCPDVTSLLGWFRNDASRDERRLIDAEDAVDVRLTAWVRREM